MVASRSLSKKSSVGKVEGSEARRDGSGGEDEALTEEGATAEVAAARVEGALGVGVGGMIGLFAWERVAVCLLLLLLLLQLLLLLLLSLLMLLLLLREGVVLVVS